MITVQAKLGAGSQKGNKDVTGIQGDGSKFAAHKSSGMLFLVIQN